MHAVQSGGRDHSLAHLGDRYYLVRASPALFPQSAHVKGLAVEVEGNHGALATAQRQGRPVGRQKERERERGSVRVGGVYSLSCMAVVV